jgi:hypothetical protein
VPNDASELGNVHELLAGYLASTLICSAATEPHAQSRELSRLLKGSGLAISGTQAF